MKFYKLPSVGSIVNNTHTHIRPHSLSLLGLKRQGFGFQNVTAVCLSFYRAAVFGLGTCTAVIAGLPAPTEQKEDDDDDVNRDGNKKNITSIASSSRKITLRSQRDSSMQQKQASFLRLCAVTLAVNPRDRLCRLCHTDLSE